MHFFFSINKLKCISFSFFYFVRNKQKGESQNGCFKKTKRAKFSEKQTFLTPSPSPTPPLIRTSTYKGLRNVRFLENLTCFAFPLPPFWDLSFYLATDDFTVSFVYSAIDVIFLSKECVTSRDKFWPMKSYKLLRICLWLAYKITKNNCVLQYMAMSFILKRGILPPLTNRPWQTKYSN